MKAQAHTNCVPETLSPAPLPQAGEGRLQRGFTYPVVLAAAVILGVFAGVAAETTSRVARVEREAELLFRGQQYRKAIRSYYEAEQPKTYPRALDDLLKDPRSPNRHHLRALYPDPLATDAKQGWTLIRAADGGIGGVASRSQDEPLKQAHFPLGLEALEGASTHSQWAFEYRPSSQALRDPVRTGHE